MDETDLCNLLEFIGTKDIAWFSLVNYTIWFPCRTVLRVSSFLFQVLSRVGRNKAETLES